MPPVLGSVPPPLLRKVLEKDGYVMVKETEYNWTFFKADAPMPVVTIPKKGDYVSIHIMPEFLARIQMSQGRFIDLLNQVRD
jgi:hypothetical protein